MPRFVILNHDWPFPHWDFMLEQGETLKTWRLLNEPLPASQVPVEALPDHRLLYLEYEGPISRERGHVSRWDYGTYERITNAGSGLTIRLEGQKIQGEAVLHDVKGASILDLTHAQPSK